MEFKAFEYSRVVFLMSVHRPAGQLFMPYAGAALVARYHFQKVPTTEEISGDILNFGIGVFNGIGINEMQIYPDGLVITTRADTGLIEAFFDDLWSWAEGEWGLRETGIPPKERHYESAIVVKMEAGRKWKLPYSDEICSYLSSAQVSYGLREFKFSPGGYSSIVDTTAYPGRKPAVFTLARRINVPFEADIFYSAAPLNTEHHLDLLAKIERSWG